MMMMIMIMIQFEIGPMQLQVAQSDQIVMRKGVQQSGRIGDQYRIFILQIGLSISLLDYAVYFVSGLLACVAGRFGAWGLEISPS